MKCATIALICITCFGCGSARETQTSGDSAAPAMSTTSSRIRSAPKVSTRKEQSTLAQDEVRVPLFVLPGDAVVEVDDVLVRRRNGTIELVGKVGDTHRVRVFWGTTQTEVKVVKIEATATSPASMDARAASVVKY